MAMLLGISKMKFVFKRLKTFDIPVPWSDGSPENLSSVIIYLPSFCYKPILLQGSRKDDILKNVATAYIHTMKVNGIQNNTGPQ